MERALPRANYQMRFTRIPFQLMEAAVVGKGELIRLVMMPRSTGHLHCSIDMTHGDEVQCFVVIHR